MEEWYRIRSAGPEDERCLTDLKSRCIQSLYRGYLPEEVLDRINATHTGQQVHDWLCDEKTCVGLLENGGAESGYVACRPDQDLDGWWLIDDIGADERLPSEQKSGLVKWALQEMQKNGFRRAHIWLLQDNFKGRFLMESFGFRPQREMKQVARADYAMTMRRYVYTLKQEK